MNFKIVKGYWNAIKEQTNKHQGKPTDYEMIALSEELAEALRKAYRYDKLKTKKAIHKLIREA
ncbi:MAG: hypothetical protein H0X26_09025 [Alphaproteobacteria bacterium]|nr:hypothetical protein [Alphaproteobacteria bacterium]